MNKPLMLEAVADEVASTAEEEPPPSLAQVVVAYSAVESLQRGDTHDLDAELETIETAEVIARELNADGLRASAQAVYDLEDIDRIAAENDLQHTLIFNLCEHLYGDSRYERYVVQRMVDHGMQFTGAPLDTLIVSLNKGHTKVLLRDAGVPTARHQVFHRGDEPITVPFPAFVKPVAEDASLGINRDSVVHDEASLRKQVRYILETYREPALVEEFIDGREFNISVWGNGTLYALPVAELDYGDWNDPYQRFLHFDAKWTPDSAEYQTMYVRCPASIDETLSRKLQDVAVQAYRVMNCRDYARVDIRLQGDEPMVLEVNANPCLASDAGFPLAARTAGYEYPAMVGQIARWAWARRVHSTRA